MATELTVISKNDWAIAKVAETTEQFMEMLSENLGGASLDSNDLMRIPIPAGGGDVWSIPNVGGTIGANTVQGVVLKQSACRVYWETEYDESAGSLPVCASIDGKQGAGIPGGLCSECQLSEFGSDKGGEGRGQACKQQQDLLILRTEDMLPMRLVIPPSSLKAWKTYVMGLSMSALPYYSVLSSFALKKVQNKDGVYYSEVVPSLAGKLDDETIALLSGIRKVFA